MLKQQQYLFTLMHSYNTALKVCRAVDEALKGSWPAVIDSDLRKALLSGSEALSPSQTHMFSLSLSAKNSCKKLFKPDKHM